MSDKGVSAMRVNASQQAKCTKGLAKEFSKTDLPVDTTNGEQRTAPNIVRITNEFERNMIEEYAKGAEKNTKLDL